MNQFLSDEEITRVRQLYRLVPDPNKPESETDACFEIQKGPFLGCVIKFGKVQIMKDEEDENQVKAQYEYDIVQIPEELREVEFSDEEGAELEDMIGDILMVLINDSQQEIKPKKIGFNSDTEDRDDNILTFTM